MLNRKPMSYIRALNWGLDLALGLGPAEADHRRQ